MDQNVIQNIKLGYRKLLLTNILNDPVHNENLEKTLRNWAAEADVSLARNEILTVDEIIRTVTAEDDNDDDDTPVNPVKISHSEAVATFNNSLQWSEEKNFKAHEIMFLEAKLISFLTENEHLIKQPSDATSSSDSDPDFSPSPRPQTYGLRPSRGSIPRNLISPPTSI
ncbi:hypothetical protein AVEN_57305-1 [Araneus ventricosus]|uniref:DDE-1 domain-containing protein n=1 Tax=Araneus ventricosus TaxID=182803 RepID=A0A4Y2ITA6_ARAVE|nr:hypothetical protein AVEN_57305-1 [Araneus ventricosus]